MGAGSRTGRRIADHGSNDSVNKGQSPALNVVSKARLSILATPISDDWERVPGRNAAPMFPEATGHGFNTTITITPGTAAAYRAGKLTVWVTGRISYLDAFGRPHWTNFCAYHTPDLNRQLFSLCDTGNELDREEY